MASNPFPWNEQAPNGVPDPNAFRRLGFPGGQMGPQPPQPVQQPAPTFTPPTVGQPIAGGAPPRPGQGPVSLPVPQNLATPQAPQTYQAPHHTGKVGTTTNVLEGIAAFQNARQQGDARRQQELQQQGQQAIARINAIGQQANMPQADIVAAQRQEIAQNAAALRAVGIPIPADANAAQKPNILKKVLNAIQGTPDRTAQNAKPDVNAAMKNMPGQSQEDKYRQGAIADAQDVQDATRKIPAETRAGIAAGTIAKPADIAKAESAAADKSATAEATASEKRKTAFRLKGMDENGDPLSDEQLPPEIRIKKIQAQAAGNLAQSRVALNDATIALKKAELSGNLPSIQIHRQAVQVAQQNANTAEANYMMHAKGTDRSGNELPGVQHDASGAPMGTVVTGQQNAAAKGDQATNTTRAAAEFARTLQPKFDKADVLISKLDKEGKLGVIASRYDEFMAGKVGAGDPDYAKLRTMIGFMNTAMVRTHFGARGAASILDRFDNYASSGKMDAETLKAALSVEKDFVDTYANMDYAEKDRNKERRTGAPAPQGAHGQPGVPNGANAIPQKATQKTGDVVQYQGKPHRVVAVNPDGTLQLAAMQ